MATERDRFTKVAPASPRRNINKVFPIAVLRMKHMTKFGQRFARAQKAARARGAMYYLAVRDDGAFRKQVALKVLRKDQVSEELIRRFHQERQVLANLDHPNIARILDGGQSAEGLPYYVMEYVNGVALDRFCDEPTLMCVAHFPSPSISRVRRWDDGYKFISI